MIDQNGTQVESVYDLASRLKTKTLLVAGSGVSLLGTLSQNFEWDGLGILTKAIDDNGGVPISFDRAYDSLGRVYIENQSLGGSTLTSEGFWKGEGLRWNFLFPNGRSLLSAFDNMNRLKTIDGAIGYEYVGQGRILDRSYPNGTKLTYRNGLSMTGYDGARRIIHQKWQGPSSTTLADFEYSYDRESHRKTQRRLHQLNGSGQPKGEFYDYDSAYRLTDWKESWVQPDPLVVPAGGGTFTFSGSGSATITVVQTGGYPIATQLRSVIGTATDTQEWTLDGVGNWEQMKRKGSATNNTISAHNAYFSWGNTPQAYDTNGNLADDGSYLYRYDFLNRLREVKLKATSAVIASYEYDAMNRRITKTVSGSTTRFFYDGWHAVEERVGGSVTKQFVYGQTVDEILKMDTYASGSISATHYYHTDALGSVVAITDSAGAVVERLKYSPYGQPYWMNAASNVLFDGAGNFVNASAVGNPLLFTAARYDAETANRTSSQITDTTGAYYLRNRYLDSDKGRFITRDPIGIWGDDGNLGGGYSYCGGNPVDRIDPFGNTTQGYPTADQAAVAAISQINPMSISSNTEFAGWVYVGSDGKYYATAPQKGGAHESNPGSKPPKAAADYHTHGDDVPDKNPKTGKFTRYRDYDFSSKDIAFGEKHAVDLFLGCPDGSIFKWDCQSGKIFKFNPKTGKWDPVATGRRGSKYNEDDAKALEEKKKKKKEQPCNAGS